MPDPGEELGPIRFDPLTSAAPIPPLPTDKLGVDRPNRYVDPGGKPVDQGNQGLAMRFTRGPVSQHVFNSDAIETRILPRLPNSR